MSEEGIIKLVVFLVLFVPIGISMILITIAHIRRDK